jgi:O-antigen/teichoic acid export membrane protein
MLGAAAIIILVILAVMHPEPIIVYGTIIYYFAMAVGSSGELIVASFFAGEKFQYHLFVLFMERLCLLVLVALVAFLDLGFLAIFCAYVVSKSVKASLAVYYLKKHFYRIIFKFNVSWIIKIIKESYLIGFGISIGLGFHHAVIILLREFINAKTAGIFAAYYILILRCQLLSVALSRSLMPQISIAAKKNPVTYARLTKTGLLLLFVSGSLLAIILWPFKGFIIRLLYGEPFMIFIDGFGYLILLLPFLFSDNILNVAFISRGLVKNFLIAKVAGFSVGIVLSGLLAVQYHFYAGVYGIISGKLVATFIMAFFLKKLLSSIPARFESHRDSAMAVCPKSEFFAHRKR